MTVKERIKQLIAKDSLVYSKPDSLFLFLAGALSVPIEKIKDEIQKMLNNGEIFEIRKGKFSVLPSRGYVKGKFMSTSKGFAFCDIGTGEDVFIPGNLTNGAIDGDEVVIKLFSTDNGADGEIVSIVKPVDKLVGTVTKINNNNMFLIPDNDRIPFKIPLIKSNLYYKANQKVVVKLLRRKNNKFSGEVVEVLGLADDVKTLELAIIREHNLYEQFDDDVEESARELNKPVSTYQKKGRLDLTKITTFTIDGEDAKDFDDAVSIKPLADGGFELDVHIADVGEYVKEGSLLDQAAFERGTSTYFPSSVLPMLPTPISNGICSLNEGVERLAISCIMRIDKEGNVVKHNIYESVIKSKARLTYNEVYPILLGKKSTEKANSVKNELIVMGQLAKILQRNRVKRGALDLDIPETEFIIDTNGYVTGFKKRERNDAHRLIEEFMILANETIARHFNLKDVPFVYRVHEKPTQEKLKVVYDFLKGAGISVPAIPRDITPEYICTLLELANKKDYSEILNKIILRGMQKAIYKNENLGHFGLALDYYCHFTSPIRRYPDLTIHRIIKEYIRNKNAMAQSRKDELEEFACESALQSSETERNSEKAERDVDDLWKAYLMKDKIGQEFNGTITNITKFGVFVGLDNSAEGLIRIEDLPGEKYLFFEKSLELKNQTRTFKIGDKIRVKLVNVDLQNRKIDFLPVLANENTKKNNIERQK